MKATFLAVMLLAALFTGIWQASANARSSDVTLNMPGMMLYRQGAAVSEFVLLDQNRQQRHRDLFGGRWNLVFFGYTFCPDICPTTLADMNRVWKKLSPEAQQQLQLVFVSIDPERDSPESMQPYLRYFNPAFIGLTGNPAAMQTLVTELNGFFARVERGEGAPYLMDHSANMALVSPAMQYRGYIEPPFSLDRMVPMLEALVQQR